MPDGLCAWCSLCGAEISDRMRIVNGHSYCRQCGSPVQYINIDALLREVKHYFQQATEYQQESARLKDEVSRLQSENDRLRGEVIVSDCLLRDVVKRVYDAASLEQRYGSESRSRAFPLLADKIRCVLAGHAYGDCCAEWEIEFRSDNRPRDDARAYRLAVEAWNAAPRAVPAVCPQCEGEGVVTDAEALLNGKEFPAVPCPTCAPFGGRGAIMVPESEVTPNEVP